MEQHNLNLITTKAIVKKIINNIHHKLYNTNIVKHIYNIIHHLKIK